ncbi:MAG: hypothetical protein U1E89_12665 [Burkholderiaceae bacterium]
MKPISQLNDDEFERQLQRAAAMPDAPATWVKRAIDRMVPAAAVARQPTLEGALRRLAALLSFDSWALQPMAAGVRSVPAQTRHLLFSSQGRDIDLRITPSDGDYALTGQILGPDDTGTVELSHAAAQETCTEAAVQSAPLDELGEFRLEGVPRGTYRLTLRVGRDEIALPPIAVGERPS